MVSPTLIVGYWLLVDEHGVWLDAYQPTANNQQPTLKIMPKKLTASQLRKTLMSASKEQLVDEIVALFTKFNVVQNHLSLRMSANDDTAIFEQYKARVTKAMLPKSDFGFPKVMEARKLISEYRKIALDQTSVIDLMLVYVECGVEFIRSLGDYKESFYDSLSKMFVATLKLIQQEGLEMEFRYRCRLIVQRASKTGYGFEDEMRGWFEDYFKQG